MPKSDIGGSNMLRLKSPLSKTPKFILLILKEFFLLIKKERINSDKQMIFNEIKIEKSDSGSYHLKIVKSVFWSKPNINKKAKLKVHIKIIFSDISSSFN